MRGVAAVLFGVAALGMASACVFAYGLVPDVHETHGSWGIDYSEIDFASGVISIDPDMLRPYDLHRYIVDGRIVVLEGSANPFGMRDIRLSFHQQDGGHPTAAGLGEVTGASAARALGATGEGVVVAIVDTGTDFSNPDLMRAVARDADNHPLMLDPDGQGIILTNSTFAAFVDENGVIRNAPGYPVYVDETGVYLDIYRDGEGTTLSVYNPLYPILGNSPVLEGVMDDDLKIGHSGHDYIKSQSGIYHMGVLFQMNHGVLQAVPMLVTDPDVPGVYDTIIPDMATAWQDHADEPELDFDFTDDTPIRMGSGNEILAYDADGDGLYDYSAGMLGARVLDVYGVFGQTTPDDYVTGALNATLLDAVDAEGNYLGVMTDMHGHGTATAGMAASRGEHTYNIYNNSELYTIPGTAPGSTILPVKALWYGSTEYGWLWAAGMDNDGTGWEWSGERRAHVISNSWGVPVFPLTGTAPGYDYVSLLSDILSVPGSLDDGYPGVLVVSSAGNAGHGYGSITLPSASSLALTVGATSNSGYTGYGFFAEQPRFGNSTTHYGHLAQLTSRGPGPLGETKPDILSVGAYGFSPSWMTRDADDDSYEAFGTFGGTSMAAPLAAGGAAVVIEQLELADIPYTPFTVKNILMSTASDTGNDPMAQGTGRLNVVAAVEYVKGLGPFTVTNDASYLNLRDALSGALDAFNRTELGLGDVYMPAKPHPMTGWFAGHLEPGARSAATFQIHNPTSDTLTVRVQPEIIVETERHQSSHTTVPRQTDPVLNGTDVYAPNYIRLSDARTHQSLSDIFATHAIPESDVMSLSLNFGFDEFMNSTADVYADDFTIASLYIYDWHDSNGDHEVDYGELALVNRGGSWGTGQEIRISYPHTVFTGVPLVGVYPVPVQASYWQGITDRNSTGIDYTMTVQYYGYEPWRGVWTDSGVVTIPPHSTVPVKAAVSVPLDAPGGVYQGYVRFVSEAHTVSMPVSYAVVHELDGETVLTDGGDDSDIMSPGLVRGAFDMSGRYTAGEWKQHYLWVPEGVESAVLEVSWLSNKTHVGVMVVSPAGEIVQTNTNPGVFGDLADWPSNDWMGYGAFGEGGGFYPVRNWNDTTTIIQISTPDPGIYTILSHVSLHGGEALHEPIRIVARLS